MTDTLQNYLNKTNYLHQFVIFAYRTNVKQYVFKTKKYVNIKKI